MPPSGHDAPVEHLTVVPFLALAREISALFVPPRMRPGFRAELEESLVIAARRQVARDFLYGPGPAPRTWRRRVDDVQINAGWVVGGALASAVSIAGIVAFVWRHRSKAA
jgi:hypothetical protein